MSEIFHAVIGRDEGCLLDLDGLGLPIIFQLTHEEAHRAGIDRAVDQGDVLQMIGNGRRMDTARSRRSLELLRERRFRGRAGDPLDLAIETEQWRETRLLFGSNDLAPIGCGFQRTRTGKQTLRMTPILQ